MIKITILGAGSVVFTKNVLGDCILTPELGPIHLALHDIDPVRLQDAEKMLENINKNYGGKAEITSHSDRKEALRGADFVINTVQIGGYEPCTVTDFEVPKKYGLRQTIADTLGIGGIFRALRTIPFLEEVAEDFHQVCPHAMFLNYTNPMAMLTGYMQKYLGLHNSIGLCHSVQACVKGLFNSIGMEEYIGNCKWEIAGINHQAWLTRIVDGKDNDLYPEIKRRSLSANMRKKWSGISSVTTSCTDSAITIRNPANTLRNIIPIISSPNTLSSSTVLRFPSTNIPGRCREQIEKWRKMREDLVKHDVEHKKSEEFGSYIINSVVNKRSAPRSRQRFE